MIRKYRQGDGKGVLDVWARASALAHPFLGKDFLEMERQNIADLYLPRADTWIWEADERVVGFISLLENEIGGLFVDPDFHRSGIGRALIGKARDLHGELEVEVFERNRVGRAFYDKLGFELMHRKRDQDTGFDILRLRLPADRLLPPR